MTKSSIKFAKSEDHIELEGIALAIFSAAVGRDPRQVNDLNLPIAAFKGAARFLQASNQVASGEVNVSPKPIAEPVWVDVAMYVQDGRSETWNPAVDRNGKPITEKLLQDPDSFAPNLPLEHPINQRAGEAGKQAWRDAQAERKPIEAAK